MLELFLLVSEAPYHVEMWNFAYRRVNTKLVFVSDVSGTRVCIEVRKPDRGIIARCYVTVTGGCTIRDSPSFVQGK